MGWIILAAKLRPLLTLVTFLGCFSENRVIDGFLCLLCNSDVANNAHKKSDGKRDASIGILNESLCNSRSLEQRNASDFASVDPEPSIKDNTVPTMYLSYFS